MAAAKGKDGHACSVHSAHKQKLLFPNSLSSPPHGVTKEGGCPYTFLTQRSDACFSVSFLSVGLLGGRTLDQIAGFHSVMAGVRRKGVRNFIAHPLSA